MGEGRWQGLKTSAVAGAPSQRCGEEQSIAGYAEQDRQISIEPRRCCCRLVPVTRKRRPR